jgi:hypothetical protein
MSHVTQNAATRARSFARENPVVTSVLAILVFFGVAGLTVSTFWSQLDAIRVPPIVAYTIGWFVATATTLGMALFLMWMNDRREVDRSRRAIRVNFDHAIMAMLDLAHKLTARLDRNIVGPAIESAQKQIIASSARLKRFENKLTAFPPVALNAYAELENEIDVTLEDLNELHRRIRTERETVFPKFGFEVMDRLSRFNDYLGMIHPKETDASNEVRRQHVEPAAQPASEVAEETAMAVRRG